MKFMKFILASMILGFTFIISAQTQFQNNIWSMAEWYYDSDNIVVNPLPAPSPGDVYDGLPAKCASNAMQDANDELWFFIVDDMIYDKEGYRIGDLTTASNSTYKLYGTAEITIVPVPDNCSQFYIFLAGSENYNVVKSNAFVAKLDMSLPTDITANSGRLGKVVFCNNLQQYVPTNLPTIADAVRSSSVFFAASKLKTDNSRFIFVSGYKGIYRFNITASALNFDNYWSFSPTYANENTGQEQRGEMELIELVDSEPVKYRLAVALKMHEIYSPTSVAQAVLCLDLNSSGDVLSDILLKYNTNINLPSNQIQPYIHGLEFSPNGNILYITHCSNSDYPKSFEYYDFSAPTNGVQSVPGISQSQSADLQYSQIEMGKSGKLYLAYSNGLATFSNPNTPLSGTLNMNEVPFTYNFNMQNVTYSSDGLKSYMLPDQIDGMDYHAIGYPSIDYIVNYTAINSETWEPGTGPNFNPWGSAYGDIYVEDKIIIPNGKSVVMKNMTFRFAPEAKIIVQQGGKLTLDNTILTNGHVECDNSIGDYWEGVEVWGTTNQHQFPQNNPTYQGMLVLKNESVIEYAHQGATNWNPDVWSEIGGVIQAENSTFKNNRRDIALWRYENFLPNDPSQKYKDFSNFKNTQFVTDDDFIEGQPRQGHVTLWDVHGINFTNCHFANNITGNKSASSSPHEGISSLDASFRVIPGCAITPPAGSPCPSSSLLKSSFTGLEYGVLATGAGSSRNVTVSQSDFSKNLWGVRIDGFDNSSIDRNNIAIADGGYSPLTGKGISLYHSTGHITEENTVTNNLSMGVSTYGITVVNGGPSENRLYKNTLNDLSEGTSGYGRNRSANYLHGLQFLCNDYNYNSRAIRIGDNFPSADGVRKFQGESSPTSAAGNTFQSNVIDIENDASPIVYFHSGGNTQPNVITSNVSLHKSLTRSCRSSFVGIPIIIYQPNTLILDSLELALNSYDTAYTNLHYNYVSLIDNGNTDILQGQIENNWSSDAWNLRNNLMQESPYLSSEALLTAASENILPNAMLLEVLLANPDATSAENFIEELDEVTNYTMPSYMLDFVRDNWDAETVRTNLEIQMAHYSSQISSTQNFIKYLEKSKDEYNYAERKSTVEMGEGISNKFGVIDFYIENEEWLKADSVLVSIQNDDELEEELSVIEDLPEYLTFRASLGSRNIAQLDSTEILYLQTLAEKGNRASVYAENILCFFYDICYDLDLEGGTPMAKMINIPSGDEPTLEEIMYNITVYPNPASDFTNIKWEIFAELNNSHYKIFDLNGREMGSGTIGANEGEEVIDTRNFSNGVYIINIYNDGITKLNSKLIVNKEK